MAINLVTKFAPLVDERFAVESKSSLVTNKDYDFIGAKSIKLYSVSTAEMNDYGRNTDLGTGEGEVLSRYGVIKDLSTEIQEVQMEKDRSFTFVVDKMDQDETLQALNAGSALARQLKEVVMPEVDAYTFKTMVDNAGNTQEETITKDNAYTAITDGNEVLDEASVPIEGRTITCTPTFYKFLKQNPDAVLDTEIGQDMRIKGVVASMDGANIQKIPTAMLPENVNFILSHKVATTQAIKLAEYKINNDPQGISGVLVEGRIYYTAFVRNNKKNAIYVSMAASNDSGDDSGENGESNETV